MRILAGGLVLFVLLAGCGSAPGDGEPATTATATPSGPAPARVDGQAVYDRVAGVVTKTDGSPRFRVPGTPDHAEAARWLAGQMEVPGWTVSWQNFTGNEYRGLDKGEVKAYYEGQTYCKPADRARLGGLAFSNLVARLESPSDRTMVLGAHWESKRNATQEGDRSLWSQPVLGANDGASGVGVLLQLLRELPGEDLPFDVEVVLFDGEDGFEDCHPLAGSLWYVDGLDPAERDGMRMLLLDMVGDPDARFIREARGVRCDPDLVDLLAAKAPRHGLADNFQDMTASVYDDHVPFTQVGIPGVDLIDYGRGFPPYWHTTGDTMENLSPDMLGDVASLVLDVLRDPAFVSSWPDAC